LLDDFIDSIKFIEPILIIGLDNEHTAFNKLLPMTTVHNAIKGLYQLEHINSLIKLIIPQVQLNQALKSLLNQAFVILRL
jgi:hypothetical protein